MSFHRSANSSPRRRPERIASPTIVRASGGNAVSSAAACAVVSAHFGRTHLERRQIDAARRILLEVAPLHRRAKHRAQHIVNVIDGLGRVPRLREMSHVRLDLLSRHVRERLVAEPRQQVLLQHEAPMLLRRVLVHRQHRRLPFARERPERDARSRRRLAVACGRELLRESV